MLRLHLCVGFLNSFREKTTFYVQVVCVFQGCHFSLNLQFENKSFQLLFDCFYSGFESTSCFLLRSTHHLGRAALLPGVFLAEPWVSKGNLPVTEANVAVGARESLCIQCRYNYYSHAPSAASNPGRQ